MYRVLTGTDRGTTTELVEMAVHAGVAVKSLSVQNTTPGRRVRPLHRTAAARRVGKSVRLRDAAETGNAAMNRMMAIVEREMRKFFRSPALMLASMIFPLVQLIVLGNAFGGKIATRDWAWSTRTAERRR